LLDVAVGVIDADKPVSVYVDVARASIVESSAITTCNTLPAGISAEENFATLSNWSCNPSRAV
jgi:hypothetical protein